MMKEEAPAPEGGAPEGGGEGDPAEAIAGIAGTVNEGLQMLAQVFEQVGSDPSASQKLAKISQAFQQVVGQAMGGGGAPQGPADGQPAPENGQAAGAVPADPARY